MIRSLLVFFFLALPQLAHASVAIDISCEQFVVDHTSGGAIKDVCAEHQMYGPSPAITINDTFVVVEYNGDYVDIYNILLDLNDTVTVEELREMSTANYATDYPDYLSGLLVQVTRFEGGGCEVAINGTACTNCEVCGGENSTFVSADCSAIPGGRAVECESLDEVYYPFEGYYAVADGDMSTEAPLSADNSNAAVSASPRTNYMAASFATIVAATVGTVLQM